MHTSKMILQPDNKERSRIGGTKIQISDERRKSKKSGTQMPSPTRISTDYRPSPQEFDEFIPWMCLQFQSPDAVQVTRIYQEDYVKAIVNRRASSKTAKNFKTKLRESLEVDQPKESLVKVAAYVDDDSIHIKAYYNLQGQLQEVSFVDCPISIKRTAIKALCLAIPFHPTLFKLTISKGWLTAAALREIGKILPRSYLTDICLDDTFVPQQNYIVLLETASRLRNLSLNRCQLGDEMCKKIIACIDIGYPGDKLRTLELSSNRITDEAAFAFANLLRRNRRLLHLNLSGNLITDKGASAILNMLKEFPLTTEEITNMKRCRLEYNREKIQLYDRFLKEMMSSSHRSDARTRSRTTRGATVSTKIKSPVLKKANKKSPTADMYGNINGDGMETIRLEYAYPELEQRAREKMGKFTDSYDADHIILKDKYFYCVGNMFLCSLNLAYNNLELSSIQKINLVLEYQFEARRPPGATGLLRINFEGNNLPRYCEEYILIELLLNNAIGSQLPKTINKKTMTKTIGQRKSS